MTEGEHKATPGSERMKRRAPLSRMGMSTFDVRQDFSDEQLQEIGAVLMEWNVVEWIFLHVFTTILDIKRDIALDLFKRINGLAAKAELARMVVRNMKPPAGLGKRIKASLDALDEYRGYRDLIAHCRMFNKAHAIGESTDSHGRDNQILLGVEALTGLYQRLVLLKKEMIEIGSIFQEFSRQVRIVMPPSDIPEEQQRQSRIQEHVSQLQLHQKQRLELQPLPKFPV